MNINLNSGTVCRWRDFTNAATGTAVTDATIAGTVTDLDGTEVTTFTLTYDSAQGLYQGQFSSTAFVENQEYFISVTATKGSVVGHRRHRATAKYDTFN